MSSRNKIEQYELGQYVLDLYSQGLSTRQISDRIKAEKNRSVGFNTISRYLSSVKDEARQVSQAVRQEHVRKKLPGHLDTLDRIIVDLDEKYFAVAEDGGPLYTLQEKLAIVKQLRPTIELVIGRVPPDEDLDSEGGEEYLEEIERKLDSIVEHRRKAAIPQKPDAAGAQEAPV